MKKSFADNQNISLKVNKIELLVSEAILLEVRFIVSIISCNSQCFDVLVGVCVMLMLDKVIALSINKLSLLSVNLNTLEFTSNIKSSQELLFDLRKLLSAMFDKQIIFLNTHVCE